MDTFVDNSGKLKTRMALGVRRAAFGQSILPRYVVIHIGRLHSAGLLEAMSCVAVDLSMYS